MLKYNSEQTKTIVTKTLPSIKTAVNTGGGKTVVTAGPSTGTYTTTPHTTGSNSNAKVETLPGNTYATLPNTTVYVQAPNDKPVISDKAKEILKMLPDNYYQKHPEMSIV